MISIDDILILHEKSIRDYSGMKGIRDPGMLESAIAGLSKRSLVMNFILRLIKKQLH